MVSDARGDELKDGSSLEGDDRIGVPVEPGRHQASVRATRTVALSQRSGARSDS